MKSLLEYLANRPRILEAAARNFPAHADSINKKLQEVQEDSKIWKDREEYEGLLILFEKVLDECEAELASHGTTNYLPKNSNSACFKISNVCLSR